MRYNTVPKMYLNVYKCKMNTFMKLKAPHMRKCIMLFLLSQGSKSLMPDSPENIKELYNYTHSMSTNNKNSINKNVTTYLCAIEYIFPFHNTTMCCGKGWMILFASRWSIGKYDSIMLMVHTFSVHFSNDSNHNLIIILTICLLLWIDWVEEAFEDTLQ